MDLTTEGQAVQPGVGRPAEAVICLTAINLVDLYLSLRRLEESMAAGVLWIDDLAVGLVYRTLKELVEGVSDAPFPGCRPAWLYP
jgi:hypothetical protein